MGEILADLLCCAPGAWKELSDEQKEEVKAWWRGPNRSFNHDEETVEKLVYFFENY